MGKYKGVEAVVMFSECADLLDLNWRCFCRLGWLELGKRARTVLQTCECQMNGETRLYVKSYFVKLWGSMKLLVITNPFIFVNMFKILFLIFNIWNNNSSEINHSLFIGSHYWFLKFKLNLLHTITDI